MSWVTSVNEPVRAQTRLLFVCTANISRSPYAERRASHMAGARGADGQLLRIESAGIPGFPGRGMDERMATEVRRRGGDTTGHVSRSLTSGMLALADLVVTFEYAQRLRILAAHPGWDNKLFGLHQLVDAVGRTARDTTGYRLVLSLQRASIPDSMAWDVADPYHRGAKAARRAADEIDHALSVIVPTLFGSKD